MKRLLATIAVAQGLFLLGLALGGTLAAMQTCYVLVVLAELLLGDEWLVIGSRDGG